MKRRTASYSGGAFPDRPRPLTQSGKLAVHRYADAASESVVVGPSYKSVVSNTCRCERGVPAQAGTPARSICRRRYYIINVKY